MAELAQESWRDLAAVSGVCLGKHYFRETNPLVRQGEWAPIGRLSLWFEEEKEVMSVRYTATWYNVMQARQQDTHHTQTTVARWPNSGPLDQMAQ